MDFNNTNKQNNLISAAMVLGVSAIVSACIMTVYFPFILGSISIILALLSKGAGAKLADKAKKGIICSVVAIVLNIFIIGGSLYMVFASEANFHFFNSMYESIYGESFSDVYEELTGEEFFY